MPSYETLTAQNRGKLRFSAWGGRLTRILNSAYFLLESAKPDTGEEQFFDSIFPFARKTNYLGLFGYFHLFGRRGLAEYQVLVPDEHAEHFLREARRLILDAGVSSVLVSMKLFRGTMRFLRFEGDGVCITLNFARSLKFPDFWPGLTNWPSQPPGCPT